MPDIQISYTWKDILMLAIQSGTFPCVISVHSDELYEVSQYLAIYRLRSVTNMVFTSNPDIYVLQILNN